MKAIALTFFFLLGFLFKIQVQASELHNHSCYLPKNEKLVVACTTKCGRFTKWGVNRAARMLGYKVEFKNLYNAELSIDLKNIDAVIIQGGADIAPVYYKRNVDPQLREYLDSLDDLVVYTEEGARRDPFEYKLLQEYFSNSQHQNLPLLGICRGMQMLTVSQGIPLYIDLEKELGIKNRNYNLDLIQVHDSESLINNISKRTPFRAVEIHHQALRYDWYLKNQANFPHLKVTATSHNGRVPEVLEFSNRPALGVQYHPEYTYGHVRRNTFKWLLNLGCHKRNNR
jgi:gamma-glutamyl-gamma-aminobutyrate hydrolase PuuD